MHTYNPNAGKTGQFLRCLSWLVNWKIPDSLTDPALKKKKNEGDNDCGKHLTWKSYTHGRARLCTPEHKQKHVHIQIKKITLEVIVLALKKGI